MHAFDRRTDRRTDRIPIAIPRLHSMQRGKNVLADSGFCVLKPSLGRLGTTYDVHLGLIGKRIVDFLLVFFELFSVGVIYTAEALRVKIDQKSAISLHCGHFDLKFQVEGVVPHQ